MLYVAFSAVWGPDASRCDAVSARVTPPAVPTAPIASPTLWRRVPRQQTRAVPRVSSSSWPPLPSSAPSPPQPPRVSSRAPRRPTRASHRRRPSTRPPLGVASSRPKPAPTPETKAKPTQTPESTRDPIPTPTRLRHSRRRRRGGRWARPPTARVSRPYSRLSRRRRPRIC